MTSIYRCSRSKRSKMGGGGGAGGSSGTGGGGGGGSGAWMLVGEEPQLCNPNCACAGHIHPRKIYSYECVVEYAHQQYREHSTAQHSTDSAITLEQSSKPSMCRSEYISKEESNVRTFNMHAALFSRSMELLAFAEVAGLHLKC